MNAEMRRRDISILIAVGLCGALAVIGFWARSHSPEWARIKGTGDRLRQNDHDSAHTESKLATEATSIGGDHNRIRGSKNRGGLHQAVVTSIAVGTQAGIVHRDGAVDFNSRFYGATVSKGTLQVGLPMSLEGLGQPRLSYRLKEIKLGSRTQTFPDSDSPSEEVESNNVFYDRSVLQEKYSFGTKDLEQTFLIHGLPEGRGEIRIVGAVSTNLEEPVAQASGSSLLFKWHDSDILAISDAVAIDANGKKQPLSISWDKGSVAYVLPAEWVAMATFPIQIDPTVSSPITIKQSTSPANNSYTRTAFNSNASNNEWLVTWENYSGGSNPTISIQGQKVSAAGSLNGSQLQISTLGTGIYGQSLAYAASANRYLAVWAVTGGTLSAGQHIYGRLINADGTFYSSPEFPIELNSYSGGDSYPSVAFDGTQFFVTWAKLDPVTGYPGISGAFVSTTGTVSTIKVILSPASGNNFTPGIVYSGGSYFISWSQGGLYNPSSAACAMNTSGTITVPVTTINSSYNGRIIVGGGGSLLFDSLYQQQTSILTGMLFNTSLAATSPEFIIAPAAPTQYYTGTYTAASDYYSGDGMFYVAWDWINGTYTDNVFIDRVDNTGAVGVTTQITTVGAIQYTYLGLSVGANVSEALVDYITYNSGSYTVQCNIIGLTPPTGPSGLTATPNDGGINLTWNAVPNAMGYTISRSTVSGGPYNYLGSTFGTSFADSYVLDGTTYYYVAQYTDLSGVLSPDSNEVSAVPVVSGVKSILFVVGTSPIPSGSADAALQTRMSNLGYTVVVKPGGGTGKATSADASGKVLVAISSSVNPSDVGTTFTSVSVPVITWQGGLFYPLGMSTGNTLNTDYGTIGGQTQIAVNTQSDPIITALTNMTQPVTILSTADSLTWAWFSDVSTGSVGATVAGNINQVVVFDFDLGAAMPGLSAAPARRVGLFLSNTTAINLNNTGQSLFDAAVQWAIGAPAQLQAVWASVSSGQITLNWEASSDATSYTILKSLTPNGSFAQIATGVVGTSFTDTNCVNGTTYYYQVIALNGLGQSAPSAVFAAVPQATTVVVAIKGAPYLRRKKKTDNPDHWNTRAFSATVYRNGQPVANNLIVPSIGNNAWSIPAGSVATVQGGQTTTSCTVISSDNPDGAQGKATLSYDIQVQTGVDGNNKPIYEVVPTVRATIKVVPKLVVQIKFHFPSDDANKRTTRANYPKLFNPDPDTQNVRLNERIRLATDFITGLQGQNNGIVNVWDQASIDFYPTSNVSNDLSEKLLIGWGGNGGNQFVSGVKGTQEPSEGMYNLKTLNTPGVINVYFVHSVQNGLGAAVGGSTVFSVGASVISDTVNPGDNALAHEIGHCFDLLDEEDPDNIFSHPFIQGTINHVTQIYGAGIPTYQHYLMYGVFPPSEFLMHEDEASASRLRLQGILKNVYGVGSD